MRQRFLGLAVGASTIFLAAACIPPDTGGGPTTTAPNEAPVAVITANATSGVAHFNIEVSAADSTDADGAIIGQVWDFGDGNTAAGPQADNLYTEAGTYEVSLTITDDDGASATTTQSVVVTDDPNGRYVATDGVNAGGCTDSLAPCQTVQFAVNAADASGDTVYVGTGDYPELVLAAKDISFKGANQGRPAGVDSIGRRAESAIKGLSSGSTATNPGTVQRAISLEGMKVDPMGDTTLISASNRPLVRLLGSPAGNVIKDTVFVGGTLVPNCSSACTTMTDQAIWVQSGSITFDGNLFQNFRRAAWIYQTGPTGTLVTSGSVTGNVFKDITSVAMRIAPSGGNPAMVGITVDGNDFDNTNVGAASTPAGVNSTTGGNTITNNRFHKYSAAVYVYICSGAYVNGPQTVTGNDFADVNAGVTVYVETVANCVTGHIDGTVVKNNNFTGKRVSDGITPSSAINGTNLAAYFASGRAGIDATCNWYDTAAGPNAGGTTATTDPNVTTTPWLIAPDPGGACSGS